MKFALLVFSFLLLCSCAQRAKRQGDGIMCYSPTGEAVAYCGEVEVFKEGESLIFRVNQDSLLYPGLPSL